VHWRSFYWSCLSPHVMSNEGRQPTTTRRRVSPISPPDRAIPAAPAVTLSAERSSHGCLLGRGAMKCPSLAATAATGASAKAGGAPRPGRKGGRAHHQAKRG
jgi:hypothetical protein